MAKYIPIGEPTNRSESDSLRALRDQLPEHYVVLGNFDLRIPNRSNTLEYDAVVIGEHKIFAVEIKGWSGEIRGDGRSWHLEWGRVSNPLILTERKAKALRSYLAQAIPDLPPDLYCECVVLLPEKTRVVMADGDTSRIVTTDRLYDHFVDEAYIHEHGPGPLLDRELRERVERALLPIATPASQIPRIANYEILGEFESEEKRPFREFMGRHRLVRSRPRVRIKQYALDPLATPAERAKQFERALRDFESLSRLESNPYIARGYDVIREQDDDSEFFVISEWVGVRTLRDHIRDCAEGQPAEPSGITLAKHLLRAVQFMHDRGIVHRDLHPGVIYLTESEDEVPLKIADFDFARVVQLPSIEGSFDRLGTEGYAAPELWRQNTYDHRVDHFSLGVILFELATYRRLYENLVDMLNHEATWARRRAEVPRDVLPALEALLQSDPEQRPTSLHEIIDALDA